MSLFFRRFVFYFFFKVQVISSLEKTLVLGKIEGRRRRGQQRVRWLDSITILMDMSLNKLGDGERQGSLACCSPWGPWVAESSVRLCD